MLNVRGMLSSSYKSAIIFSWNCILVPCVVLPLTEIEPIFEFAVVQFTNITIDVPSVKFVSSAVKVNIFVPISDVVYPSGNGVTKLGVPSPVYLIRCTPQLPCITSISIS